MQLNEVPGITCAHACKCGSHVPMAVLMPEVLRRRRVTASTAPAPKGTPCTCPSCGFPSRITPGATPPYTCPKCSCVFTPGNNAPAPADSLASAIRKQRSARDPLSVVQRERIRRGGRP